MNLLQKKVIIKTGWLKGEWGIVRAVIGGEYHIAPYGSDTESMVFTRKEFTVCLK